MRKLGTDVQNRRYLHGDEIPTLKSSKIYFLILMEMKNV